MRNHWSCLLYTSRCVEETEYNESNGKNETTLVDENNVLGNFAVSYPGVDFSVSGNELYVSTSETEFGTITAEKRLPSSVPGVVTGGTKYWLRDEYQNVVTFDVEEMCIRDRIYRG